MPSHEALRSQCDADTIPWLTDGGGIAHIADMRLVDCIRPEGGDEVGGVKLRFPVILRVKTGNRGTALSAGVGIQQGVLVGEIVRGQGSGWCQAIQADGAFVIADALRVA